MKYLLLFALFLVFSACNTSKKSTVASTSQPGQLIADGKLWSSLFQQRAAEYKALCIQAFNIAHFRLDEAVQQPGQKPRAIVTDIDETFLDNSPYAVHQAIQGKDYEASSWYEWTGKGNADTIPGGWSFFNYAASKNITIFYITNRDEKDRAGTLANLQLYHFPNADNQHLIVRQATSSKEERRQQIAANYDIIMLLGDNLGDFSALFDKKTEAERDANVKQVAAEFGKKFIVLPNADYGGWEDAIYDNSRNWTPAQKDSIVRSKVKGF
jgi:5'-nucleotidase (lipoprotein e(P4) family)